LDTIGITIDCSAEEVDDLVVVFGRGGVAIIVNGTAARPLGKDGEFVTKHLTPNNLTEFLPPR
jgi:hypothetical protein